MGKRYTQNNAEYTRLCATFGRNLRRAIVERGYTVLQFARAVGIHNTILYRYVRGEALPNIYTARHYYKVLKITLDDLVSEK